MPNICLLYLQGFGRIVPFLGKAFLTIAPGSTSLGAQRHAFSVVAEAPLPILWGTPQIHAFKMELNYRSEVVVWRYPKPNGTTTRSRCPMKFHTHEANPRFGAIDGASAYL